MIDFHDQGEALELTKYYAEKLDSQLALEIINNNRDISNIEEARELTRFFWAMADLAAEDYEQGADIASSYDLERWMEKLMNIFIGYMKKFGFFQIWTDESNDINR